MSISLRKIVLFGLILSMASSELAVAAEAPSGSKWKKYLAAATVGVAAVGTVTFLVKKKIRQSLYKECRYENRILLSDARNFEIYGTAGDTITVIREDDGPPHVKIDTVVRAHCKQSLDSTVIEYKSEEKKHVVATTSKTDSSALRQGLFGFLFMSNYSATPKVDYRITLPRAMDSVVAENGDGGISIKNVHEVFAKVRGVGKVDLRDIKRVVGIEADSGSVNIRNVDFLRYVQIHGHGDVNIAGVKDSAIVRVVMESGTINAKDIKGDFRYGARGSCKVTTSGIGGEVKRVEMIE